MKFSREDFAEDFFVFLEVKDDLFGFICLLLLLLLRLCVRVAVVLDQLDPTKHESLDLDDKLSELPVHGAGASYLLQLAVEVVVRGLDKILKQEETETQNRILRHFFLK